MKKSFELVSVSKAAQVAAVRNGQVADALVARIEVGDLFNDTHFYLEVGLETKENAETILRQKVENCQTMEELIGGFNQIHYLLPVSKSTLAKNLRSRQGSAYRRRSTSTL